jgi:predicted AlkP superfamily pyrophosphatase or phosphodiesterase
LPALETADEQIARVIGAAKKAGIWNQTALVVVSDHGFARTAQRVRPGVWLREKGFVKVEDRTIVEWRAYCLASSGSAYVYVKDPDDRETRKALLEMFQQAAAKADSGIRRVLTHEQIVRVGGDPDAFLALEAAEGWAITGGVVGEAISPAIEAAEHGYPPERPEMRSSLLVYGPAIGHSKIENARMIDIAPTIARWLGLKLEKTEGTPLKIPLRRVPAPL